MRRFALALTLLWIGCGGAPPGTRGNGVNCGGRACGLGLVCCTDFSTTPALYGCAPACSSINVAVTCDGPEDCDPGGARYCCQQVTRVAASPSGMGCIESGTIQCRSSCQDTGAVAGCTGGVTSRMCRTPGDCDGDFGFTSCCARASDPWFSCVDDATRSSLLAAGGHCA